MIARFVSHSLQDLVDRIGGVPLHRIGIDPPPGTATEADVIRHVDGDSKRLYELVFGVLVEKPIGFRESTIGSFINAEIALYLRSNEEGVTSGADGPIRMIDGNIRMPEVSYFPWDSFPDGEFPDDKIAPVAPALAVEVLSESNTEAEIELKLSELFRSATRLAWVIDPATETARVYTSPKRGKQLDARGVLDGGRVLPGLKIPLRDVFAVGKRPKPKRKG